MRVWYKPQPQRPRTVVGQIQIALQPTTKPASEEQDDASPRTIPSPSVSAKTLASKFKPTTPLHRAPPKPVRQLALSRRPKPVLVPGRQPADAVCPLLSSIPRVQTFGDSERIEADLRRLALQLSHLFAELVIVEDRDTFPFSGLTPALPLGDNHHSLRWLRSRDRKLPLR